MNNRRILVAGFPVDNIDMDTVVLSADESIQKSQQCIILSVNPEKVIAARKNKSLEQCLKRANLLIADGIGIVLASRILGTAFKERVPGSELMPCLCEMAERKGYPVYLLGATELVNRKASAQLKNTFPKLSIAGRQNGYIKESEIASVVKAINDSGAKILFVALGTPKQEYWIDQYSQLLTTEVIQGVGGTFDVISGEVKRAPRRWRRMHLEWLYRLLAQPQRAFRQTRLPAYIWLVIRHRLGM